MFAEDLKKIMPGRFRDFVFARIENFEKLMEIRLRAGKPLIVVYDNKEFFVDRSGNMLCTTESIYERLTNKLIGWFKR